MGRIELKKDTAKRDLGKRTHTCRICGHKSLMQSWLVREMMLDTGDEFEYFVCDSCGCLQISEIPDDLGKYYGEGYFSFALVEKPDWAYSIPVKSMQKVLDVGCGSGEWLVALAEQGYGNLWGCDPFLSKDRQYGERVHIRNCSIHEMEGDHMYEYIHMGDSFEHVTDPMETLLSAKRLLMPGGTIEIGLPVYPNIAFDLFGPHWFQIDAPRHITLHSRKSLQYLAEKCGLLIDEFHYDSTLSEIIVSFFYQHGVPYEHIDNALMDEFFSQAQLDEIEKTVAQGNQDERGDHAVVFMMYDESIGVDKNRPEDPDEGGCTG